MGVVFYISWRMILDKVKMEEMFIFFRKGMTFCLESKYSKVKRVMSEGYTFRPFGRVSEVFGRWAENDKQTPFSLIRFDIGLCSYDRKTLI